MVGDRVLFQGKEYVIIHRYTSDYCEIKAKQGRFQVELVHISEIEKMHDR
jgi:hypothetical protein